MCYYPSLHYIVHSLLDSDIDVSVIFLVDWVVFVDALLGDYLEIYLDIFYFIHCIFQVEVLDVNNEVFPIW